MADAARTAVVALVVLAVATAAEARTLPATVEHTAHTAAAQPTPKPAITFYTERGCGGLVDITEGCGCIPIRNAEGYLVTFTDPGQSAVFYSDHGCSGRKMAEFQQNSCYCSPPPYRSVRLECSPPLSENATVLVGPQAHGY